jgi:vitamin B12 transport system substrate-binding protein
MSLKALIALQQPALSRALSCYAKNILIAAQITAKFFATQFNTLDSTSCRQAINTFKFLWLNCLQYSAQFIFLVAIYLGVSSAAFGQGTQRIIALSPHAVEMLYAIGAGDKIVGTVEYADYPKAALDIPRIGNYNGIQIEQVLKLKPDLIVAWKGGNKATDLDKIESLGFKVVYSQPKNISEISIDLRKLGQLTGQQEQAKFVIEQFDLRYKSIRERYQKLPLVDVFYQLWHDPLQSIGPKSWIESLISDCGGNNLFNDAGVPYPMVSIESVLVKNPKVIIIPHHSGTESEKKGIWSKWPEISAIKNKRIFTLNGDLLHRTTPRSLDGLQRLCERIDEGRK